MPVATGTTEDVNVILVDEAAPWLIFRETPLGTHLLGFEGGARGLLLSDFTPECHQGCTGYGSEGTIDRMCISSRRSNRLPTSRPS